LLRCKKRNLSGIRGVEDRSPERALPNPQAAPLAARGQVNQWLRAVKSDEDAAS
jgi:hypothetical protein